MVLVKTLWNCMHSCTPSKNGMAISWFYILLIDYGRQVYCWTIPETIQLCIVSAGEVGSTHVSFELSELAFHPRRETLHNCTQGADRIEVQIIKSNMTFYNFNGFQPALLINPMTSNSVKIRRYWNHENPLFPQFFLYVICPLCDYTPR